METKILSIYEFQKFIYQGKGLPNILYKNLKEDIHYFSWDDLNTCFSSDKYLESLRYIICINEKNIILGIAKIAVYECN